MPGKNMCQAAIKLNDSRKQIEGQIKSSLFRSNLHHVS